MDGRNDSPHFHRSRTRPQSKRTRQRRSGACFALLVGASCGAFAQQYDRGSSLHVVLELFKLAARVDMSHVPYRSGGQALGSAVSGEVQGAFANSVAALPHARCNAGRHRDARRHGVGGIRIE